MQRTMLCILIYGTFSPYKTMQDCNNVKRFRLDIATQNQHVNSKEKNIYICIYKHIQIQMNIRRWLMVVMTGFLLEAYALNS